MRLTGDKVMNTFLGNLLEDKVKMKKVRYFLDFFLGLRWFTDGGLQCKILFLVTVNY